MIKRALPCRRARFPRKVSKNQLCRRLVVERVQSGLNRQMMAAKIGVSASTLRKYEIGEHDPFMLVESWAKALGYKIAFVHLKTSGKTDTSDSMRTAIHDYIEETETSVSEQTDADDNDKPGSITDLG